MSLKQSLLQNGYAIIQDFYSSYETEQIRKPCISNQFEKTDSVILGDIITHDPFRKIIFKKELLDVLRELELSNYVCDGSARGDDNIITRNTRKLHTDSRADDFDFTKHYGIYRFGIYLQSSSQEGGGLKLRPKSHKYLCIDHGNFYEGLYRLYKYIMKYKKIPQITFSGGINVKTEPSDLLIWNMRTHHSGHAIRLKFFKNLSLHPLIENIVPKKWIIKSNEKRCVVFFAFSDNSNYAIEYYNYVKNHPCNKKHFTNSDFESKNLKEFLVTNDLHLMTEFDEKIKNLPKKYYF